MLEPKPFQDKGIDFLAPQDAAIIADDAGLGKSMQLIRAAVKRGASRFLVACPAIGRVSWVIQFREWWSAERPALYFPDQTAGMVPDGPVAAIVTFEWLAQRTNARRALAALRGAQPFDVMFIDEGQFLKSPTAKRTRAVYGPRLDFQNGIGERATARWLASATLTPNHAGEIYPHLRALFPDVLRLLFKGELPTLAEFQKRFCLIQHTPFGENIVGNNPKTIPALANAIRPRIIARRKEDVLADLDPINPVLLPFDVSAKLPKGAGVDDALNRALDRIEQAGVFPDEDAPLQMLNTLSGVGDSVSTRRRELGLAKLPVAVEWIENFLSGSDKKLVVFAHHTDVIEGLMGEKRLAGFNPVSIYGKTPNSYRSKYVERFQSDDTCRLFVGHVISAGTSITLTAASDVLLLEPDWTPINNYQAISRCHRIGQRGSVTAYFAHAAGTIDERIAALLRRKAKDFAQLFGGQTRGHA